MTVPAALSGTIGTLVKSVALFNLGTLINDQSSLTMRRGMGTRVEVPVTGALIEMTDGEHILFDTGLLPHDCERDDRPPLCLSMKRFSEMIARYERQDDIRARLAELGRTPEDVKIVINLLCEFFGGELVICHDPDFWKKWQPAPHRYT
jgi:N-acyl homoserine lactone hydrolase